MQILLTENEKEYIDMSSFGWKIKANCPDNIRKKIEMSMILLKQYQEEIERDDINAKREHKNN